MNIIDLNGKWELECTTESGEQKELCGIVPGNTLDAVLNDCVDFDVFYRDNAEKVQNYENCDWVYSRNFEFEKKGCTYNLCFERLDTYCDIYLNGKHIRYCENGNIGYSFDVTAALVSGENILKVYFYSPIRCAAGRPARKFCAFSTDRLYTRRMQCTYGWDWTMRFVTCGIGSAYIEEIPQAMRVEDVYVYTKSIDEDCAEVVADITFADFEEGEEITAELVAPDGSIACSYTRYNEEEFMRISMDVAKPLLWFPNGYGDSPLYWFVIKGERGELYSAPFGIRTAKIMQLKDSEGSPYYELCCELKKTDFADMYDLNTEFSGFILKINGKKIMCKGANWVPCEPFGVSDTKEKVTRLLTLAKEAGVNMLRVWGGGAFESEHFYDECSRLGIMVTQDFLMACGDYPEEQQWFLENLRMEARYAVKLLKNKTCLVWWTGDNENASWGTNQAKWYHGRISAYKAIAPVLYKADYTRSFLPSSPFGGARYACSTAGTTHNTQFLSYMFKYIEKTDMSDFKEKFKEYRARFIAEEPIMGAASVTTLRKIMADDDIFGDGKEMWLYHTKNNPCLTTELFDYERIMSEKLFGEFADGQDRLFKLKYLQYEWMRISIEQVRRGKWFTSGVIYWMFDDSWPAASGWAFVDYYCTPKASYYSFKRGAKAVVGSIDRCDGKYCFHISNDSDACQVSVRCFTLSGKEIWTEKQLKLDANCSAVVFETEESISEGDMMFMEICDEHGNFDRAFHREEKLILKPCDVEVVEKTDTYVKVRANSYVHAVELEGEGVFEDNYFSLMPSEERTVGYKGIGEIEVCGYTVK